MQEIRENGENKGNERSDKTRKFRRETWIQRKWSACGGKGGIGENIKKMGRDSIRENGKDENRSERLEKTERMKREKRDGKKNMHYCNSSLTKVLFSECSQEGSTANNPL